MKAVVWTKYGGPEHLEVRELEKPKPGKEEVLIRVHSATVTAGDCEIRNLDFPIYLKIPFRFVFGLSKPKPTVLGQELSGTIEAIGEEVDSIQVGSEIYAATLMKFGAYAEYALLPASYVREKPPNISLEGAATIPTGGLNGLHFLNVGGLKSGDRVLINGAGGSIGTYSMQIARHWGAKVTAVDSGIKLQMLKENGAEEVIDYKTEDLYSRKDSFDVIIDIVGTIPIKKGLRMLRANGRLVNGNPRLSAAFAKLLTPKAGGKKVFIALAKYTDEDYLCIHKLIEEGVIKPVIDRRFQLEELTSAHKYVEDGLKKGNLIISVNESLTN